MAYYLTNAIINNLIYIIIILISTFIASALLFYMKVKNHQGLDMS